MAGFKPNDEGIRKMMEKVGRERGERYKQVDAAARKDQAAEPMTEADREAWLRQQLARRDLPALENMAGWARTIVDGETFEIRINVR